MRLGTQTRGTFASVGVALGTICLFFAVGNSAQARLTLRSCAPAQEQITYNGTQINFYGPLSSTRNVTCSTARAMSRYVSTHEVEAPFEWHGSRWTAGLSRPDGNDGPTVYTIRTTGKLIRDAVAVPVS